MPSGRKWGAVGASVCAGTPEAGSRASSHQLPALLTSAPSPRRGAARRPTTFMSCAFRCQADAAARRGASGGREQHGGSRRHPPTGTRSGAPALGIDNSRAGARPCTQLGCPEATVGGEAHSALGGCAGFAHAQCANAAHMRDWSRVEGWGTAESPALCSRPGCDRPDGSADDHGGRGAPMRVPAWLASGGRGGAGQPRRPVSRVRKRW